MKRVIQLFTVMLILSSCASLNGNLRLVRTGEKQSAPLVEQSSARSEKEEPVTYTAEVNTVEESAGEAYGTNLTHDEADVESATVEAEDKTYDLSQRAPQELTPDEDEQIADQAYQAERDANKAFWLFFAGLTSAFLPYLGIIPFIIGLIYYSRSKSSRYITQWGDRRSNSATVLLVIDGVILLFWILLIVLLVLLL